jgi:multiple sugar transport system permease protein
MAVTSTERAAPKEKASLSRQLFGISQYKLSRYLFCYISLLPILTVYTVIRIIPILQTFWLSFTNAKITGGKQTFIGLHNFAELLKDHLFQLAISNTTLYAVGTVVGSTILGLALAVILATGLRGSSLFELLYFIPVITPWVPVSIAWKWIYDPTVGLLNYLLSFLGIEPHGWLLYPDTALWAIIVMAIWKVIGYNMVIFLVGIRSIPVDYYESASMDGASGWDMLRHITMPLLKPITLFVLVVSTINAYNVFTPVYVMTTGSQGAPGSAVRVLVFDMYENAFRYFRLGYASTEALVLFLIILFLTLVQFRIIRTED